MSINTGENVVPGSTWQQHKAESWHDVGDLVSCIAAGDEISVVSIKPQLDPDVVHIENWSLLQRFYQTQRTNEQVSSTGIY